MFYHDFTHNTLVISYKPYTYCLPFQFIINMYDASADNKFSEIYTNQMQDHIFPRMSDLNRYEKYIHFILHNIYLSH